MKSNRVTKERHKALIEDYVAQLEQADTDKVRATSGSDAVTTLSLDAVRLPPPATPGAGALGDDVYNAAGLRHHGKGEPARAPTRQCVEE